VSTSVAVDPWDDVVGQGHAVTQLRAAALSPVHAYLLVGQRGSGKRTLARAFAAALLSVGLDGEEAQRAIHLVLEGKHPDLHEFERSGPFISAPQADAIVREASRSPVEGARKVLVLIDFHLVEQAGPKLLKTIEEPSPSTVFVVLAEQVPPELVTIASRCVRIDCDVLTPTQVANALMGSGIDPDLASEVAAVAGADLDRARLLATDPRFGLRRDAWRGVPDALDGNGATVHRLVADLLGTIKDAQAPLDARHADELAALEARVALYGERGAGRRDLIDRQKREARRHRADELRFGFATIAARYRDAAAADPTRNGLSLASAVAALHDANEAIIRNPNEPLLLQALLLRLPSLRAI
jgi:DNA polymerase-3 subunit delta'